jgi:hypothetical protein
MTGNLNNRRWFSSSVLLPNGQVVVFNGADKDEVILPGSEMPVHQAELFDPTTNKWTALSSSARDRTYHNSAILLPDGSILVGGHAPINQGYGGTGNSLPLDTFGFSHNLKDPSFERFYPPYLFEGPRPVIQHSDDQATWGGKLHVVLAENSTPVDHFVLSRLPAQTHITDADARTVILKSTQTGNSVQLDVPTDKAALTPGYYYLFGISKKTPDGKGGVPSEATIVHIADTQYLRHETTVEPVHLAAQEFRGGGSSASVQTASRPAAGTRVAKKSSSTVAGTEPKTARDIATPTDTSSTPAGSSRAWLFVVAALMITVVSRRLWTFSRR